MKEPKRFIRKHFLTWLNAQPALREFNYFDTNDCMMSSFVKEFYAIQVSAGGNYIRIHHNDKYISLPERLIGALSGAHPVFTVNDIQKIVSKKGFWTQKL